MTKAKKTTVTDDAFKPIIVREGAVVVRITQIKSKTATAGKLYRITPSGGGKPIHRAELEEAKNEARALAKQLSQGVAETHHLQAIDVQELHKARVIAAGRNTDLMVAMQEWNAARDFGVSIIEASRELAKRLKGNLVRIALSKAIEDFKASKPSKKTELTYGSKLKTVERGLGGATYIDTLLVSDFNAFLKTFKDIGHRNDIRKRIVTLMRWAQDNNHLPLDSKLEIERTKTINIPDDQRPPVGIIKAAELSAYLAWVRKHHPWGLAATVLSSLLGLRQDEVQGKRPPIGDSRLDVPRQRWDHIYINEKEPEKSYLTVSVAKNNTPSMRDVPLTPQAIAWLKLCYIDGKKPNIGYVIEGGGSAKLRALAIKEDARKELGFRLPENSLRHSWITADVCHTNGKNAAATALKAGNSVQTIHSNYKGKMTEFEANEYLAVMPAA
jgi:hypothetical protein